MLPSLKSTKRVGIEVPEYVAIPQTSQLSKQPGNNWDDTAFKANHNRSQGLQRELMGDSGTVYKQTHIKKEHVKPELMESTNTLLKCLEGAHEQVRAERDDRAVDLTTKVLRYNGYWREASVESAVETSRLRKVVLCVFPHDETVMVLEPRVPNSGIQGGTLVKRHRIPAGVETARKRNRARDPDRRIASEELDEDQPHLNPTDFQVGDDVTIYGKCIHIVDCDVFTREFLQALGQDVGDPEPYPTEEYFAEHTPPPPRKPQTFSDYDMRKTFEMTAKGRVTSYYPDEVKTIKRFLHGEAQVCRFWAYWDDRDTQHGDIRRFEIRYHVQDDTTEVLERLSANSGREPSRAFVTKRKLPKNAALSRASDLTFHARSNGHRFEVPPGGRDEDEYFYTLRDFRIGSTINVFGRPLRVYSADPWTREFFKRELGESLEEDAPIDHLDRKPEPPVLRPSKHNGLGTEEDSLGNCKSLVLRAPRRDVTKWQKHADTLLRFKLKLHNPADANDTVRRFILTFYVADDTLMINEISVRNTGFLAGRFLKRQKAKKYDGEGPKCYYTHEDLVPGEVLRIAGHTFEMLDMDEYTQRFKEGVSSTGHVSAAYEVPKARVTELASNLRRAITTKHVTLTEAFRHYDTDRDGALPLHEVAEMFKNLNIKAEEAELVAVMHYLDTDKDGKLSLNEFVAGITGNTVKSLLDGEEAEYGTITRPDSGGDARFKETAQVRPHVVVRERVLKVFKEKLESKQLNVFEMYRMLSTMPSSHNKGAGRDVAALGSGGTDSLLGPVQLRRGIAERFSFGFTQDEMDHVMQFFFPSLPVELYDAPREETQKYRLSLPDFQAKWAVLERIGQLTPDMSLH